jgi:hypothetical protein
MMGSNVNPEYLRRNLLVCKAVGAHAGASKSLERLRRMKRPPKWLVKSLEGVVERAEPLVSALACYRAVVPSHLTDNPEVKP